MAEPLGRGRTPFRLPRVEFDLAAVFLGAAAALVKACFWGVMAFVLAVAPVEIGAGPDGKVAAVNPEHVLRTGTLRDVRRALMGMPGVDRATRLVGPELQLVRTDPADPKVREPVPIEVPWWKSAASLAAAVVLWSVFAGAIARIHALRKARDQSTRFDDALLFSLANLRQFLTAPAFACAALGLAVAGILGSGAASAIPWAGPVLQLVLQPLAFVAALIAAVIAVGLVLGWPTMTAAIAVERGGALDAVSRTFSYVWTRPVLWALTTAVVVVVFQAVNAVTHWMAVIWANGFAKGASFVDSDLAMQLRSATVAVDGLDLPRVAADASASQAAGVWISWGFSGIVLLLFTGFAISYLIGGFVDTYFLLREEVDQVDPSEVYVEGADAELGPPLPGEPRPADVTPDRSGGPPAPAP